jgi:FMN-dependent oxidoreductase (nitrilotriacetate monooxygenase family)
MKLGLILAPTGTHVASWRHPDAHPYACDFAHAVSMSQLAESVCFDLIFLADGLAMTRGNLDAISRTARYGVMLEPLTLLSGIAANTRHIGLVATASTTYNEPFHIARKFASLDHISGGRAGWNVVTSVNETEALNFGATSHMEKSQRYARAEEFVEVVRALWESWEPDAFCRNKVTGQYFDPAKLHVPHHEGRYFTVRGPLNIERCPQGQPVLFQAGASIGGLQLAARVADAIYCGHPTIEGARAFYAALKARLPAHGRAPEDLKLMPGLTPIVGRTTQEAQDKFAQMQALVDPVVGLDLLGIALGVDLKGCDPEQALPERPQGSQGESQAQVLRDLASREGLNIRQLYERLAGAGAHLQIAGTAEQIADFMQDAFESYAADGFLLMPDYLPGRFVDFATSVVPELRRRGLFRTVYEGNSLRENMGLKTYTQ